MDINAYRPFFVYGTLRPGHGNHRLFEGHAVSEKPATLENHIMYSAGCPFLVAEEGHTAIGTLIYVDAEKYYQVLARVDALEGYCGPGNPMNWYQRRVVTVDVDGEMVEAWVYVLEGELAAAAPERYTYVPSGDFEVYEREQRAIRYAALAKTTEEAAVSTHGGFNAL